MIESHLRRATERRVDQRRSQGMNSRLATTLVAAAILIGACSDATATPSVSPAAPSASIAAPSGATGPITIYAAASLKAVLAKATSTYEGAHPGAMLTISTDSSAALETKIEQGAPADVFLSADTTNPQKLVDGGFASGAPVAFAGNLLTVIVPTANPAGIRTPADLATGGVKIIAAGDKVPVTRYAVQLVANLAKLPGYPADFAAKYAANVVSREDNVAAVVSKIELGEGDGAIVYVTDVRSSTAVTSVAVPAAANVPATYAGVIVKASRNQDGAAAFLAWLAAPDGQAVLTAYGFLPPAD
jgi:molybdate transport system substrate-binding protein